MRQKGLDRGLHLVYGEGAGDLHCHARLVVGQVDARKILPPFDIQVAKIPPAAKFPENAPDHPLRHLEEVVVAHLDRRLGLRGKLGGQFFEFVQEVELIQEGLSAARTNLAERLAASDKPGAGQDAQPPRTLCGRATKSSGMPHRRGEG